MIPNIPKISVLIICYKQEELIKRAINSLLVQRDYIYEICVSDDCSPDRTWEVLQEYDKQYPGLFKLHQNRPNVGIFENIEYTWTMPTGDIIYQLSGDDECGEGWFKTVVEYIQKNNIDYKNELFCIYGDYKCIYPNGDNFTGRNNLIQKFPRESLTMAIHGAICSRSVCYSIKILQKFCKVSQGRSYIAEDAQDRQIQLFTENCHYISKVGNIYYARVGVCVNMNQLTLNDRLNIFNYSYDFLSGKSRLSTRNMYCLKFKDALLHYNTLGGMKYLWLAFKYHVASFVFIYDLNNSRIRRIIFALLRRLPHRTPISMTL